MTAQRHAVILGMGLMGCDIAAIFSRAAGRDGRGTGGTRWPEVRARVRQSIGQLDGEPDRAAAPTLVAGIDDADNAGAES